MFLAGPKFKNPLASKLASDFRPFDPGIMEYKGDYRLDDFLEQGGASDDIAVAEFVIQDVFHGLLPIDLRNGAFGCSTISARTAKGDAVFGRNFDWGTCNALIVQTRPADVDEAVELLAQYDMHASQG